MAKTYLYWDPTEDNIVREYDEAGAITAEYTTEPDLYGNVISQRRHGEYRQFHYDCLGSTSAVTDVSEIVTDILAYTAFGEIVERSGTSTVPFQFIGQKGYYRDDQSGTSFVRRRIYDPNAGRWQSTDPLAKSNVLFVYGANSPNTRVDPSGMADTQFAVRVSDSASRKCSDNGENGAKLDFAFPNGAPCSGYFVQKIMIHKSVDDTCTKCPSPATPSTKLSFTPFWEAWEVESGKKQDIEREGGKFDYTDARIQLVKDKTCGLHLTTGEVRFYCKDAKDDPSGKGIHTGDLGGYDRPSGDKAISAIWLIDNPKTEANKQPSTTAEPGWWKNGTPAAIGNPKSNVVNIWWCCCDKCTCPGGTVDIVVKHSPAKMP